jgi:hypothetical protein
VKDHIQTLVKEGLLAVHDNGPGLDKSYYLKDEFESLKQLYNYLKDNNSSDNFLKSNYYLKHLDDESFQHKLFIGLLKDSIIKIIELLQSKEMKDKLAQSEIVFLTEFLNSELEKGQSMSSIVGRLKRHSVEELDTITIETYQRFKENLLENGKHEISPIKLMLVIFSQNLIPEKEKPYIIEILKTSPSAVEFALNLEHANTILVFSILFGHWKTQFYSLKNSIKQLEMRIQNNGTIDQDEKLLKDKNESSNNEIPISVIIKPLFMYDLINAKILNQDLPAQLIEYALSIQLNRNDAK